MTIHPITPKEKNAYNDVVSHPLQSYEWGEFREKTGVNVLRRGLYKNEKLISGFQLTIHKIPHTPFTIGYLPKGDLPTKELVEELKKIGKEEKCIFIQLEPNIIGDVILSPEFSRLHRDQIEVKNPGSKDPSVALLSQDDKMSKLGLQQAAHPLFTKYDFILDLTKSEEELLKNMHPKARYNIRVAQRHGVEIAEDNSPEAFEKYWEIMQQTTTRQKFYAHSKRYHQLQWETFNQEKGATRKVQQEPQLTSHLFLAKYQGKVLAAWILFVFKDTLYYPYGSSSSEHREVMASNLIMWEAILFGKKLGLKAFDMWGALGREPDKNDPWYGFHNFKQKYGPDHVAFIGSYDLVINPILYQAYKVADKLRWLFLRIRK